jgi:hypothetical protein
MELKARSAYMGSTIDGTSGLLGIPRRYREDGLLLRGNGTLHLTDAGLRFDYLGIDREIAIPAELITGAEVARAHGGRRPLGMEVLVVHWRHKGRVLASGFAMGEDAGLWRHYISQMVGGGSDAP